MNSCGKKIINRKNLLYNINVIKEITNKKVCAMVKANAYGHGIETIYSYLHNYVDLFGVANINEAMNLKRIDKYSKVLIVGKTLNFRECIKNKISFTIESMEHFSSLIDYIKDETLKEEINIHIKINTGMNRLGISKIDEFKHIFVIAERYGINIEGISTHFATADNDINFLNYQIENFNRFLTYIPKRYNPVIHVGGSGLLYRKLNLLDLDFDMIRVGIALYGYTNCKIKFKPVMSIDSKIIKIFELKEGEYLGYSKGFLAKKDMKIGVVPLGYGDGISRNLSNNFSVKIKGELYESIGYICMDMFFVDLKEKEIQEGEEVKVFYNAKKWASILNTIPYEILCNLSNIR